MSLCSVKLKSVFLNDISEVTVAMPDPPMRTSVTPEQFYTSGRRFKVLWLLHGGRDTLRDWALYSNVSRLAVQYGIMIVMPNGHDSDFVNHPESGDGYLFRDYFFQELMPFIHNWLPASGAPADNYLAGNSMGCAATWQYGILHPERFGLIAPLCNQPLDYSYLEPYRNMTASQFRMRIKEDGNAFRAAYGAPGEAIHGKEINAICKYETVGEFLDSVENTMQRWKEAAARGASSNAWVPCGRSERDRTLLKFKEFCEENNLVNVKFEIFEEDVHSFAFWEKAVEYFLLHLGLSKVEYFVGC
jgi:S-formylglutathione hydrolase FrmB